MEKFLQEYSIKNFNVDFRGDLKLLSVLDFCQDMAEAHASTLGIGYDFCLSKDIAWVLTNFRIVFHKMPKWNQSILMHTWPSKTRKFMCRRDFQFEVNDEIYISAATNWINLDTKTMRPVSISVNIPHFDVIDEFALEDDFAKINLPEAEKMHYQKSFEVLTSNIDLNKHVNNSAYPLWAFEAMGYEWIMSKSLKEIDITFKNQTFFNEEVHVSAAIDGNSVIQSLYKKDNEEIIEVARIQTLWQDLA